MGDLFNMKAQEITKEIQEEIKKYFWADEEGKTKISLGNYRLDFKKDYYFEKFTNKGVRMYWVKGDHKVYVMGRVEYNIDYKDFALYTEGWNYILRFKKEEHKNEN